MNTKKIIIALLVSGWTCACGTQDSKDRDIDALLDEWGETNKEAKQLSERLETTLLTWEDQVSKDSSFTLENSKCQNVVKSYKDMQISIQSFLDGWEKEAQEVERLKDQLSEAGGTEEYENQLTSMKLAIKEKEAEIERWEYNLDSLQKVCPTSSISLPEN